MAWTLWTEPVYDDEAVYANRVDQGGLGSIEDCVAFARSLGPGRYRAGSPTGAVQVGITIEGGVEDVYQLADT